jgi:hypothetical protein
MLIMRTPSEKISVARKLRFIRSRVRRTWAESVGPSAPQLRELLLFSPSMLFSPLASLRFCS